MGTLNVPGYAASTTPRNAGHWHRAITATKLFVQKLFVQYCIITYLYRLYCIN